MKTIELTEEELTLRELLEIASREKIILKTPEGQEFFISEINPLDKEIEMIREQEELMAFLEHRSGERKVYSIREVKRKLNLE
jgi:hypothetical protein